MTLVSLIFGVRRQNLDRRIGEVAAQLKLWRDRSRSRAVLATLDDRMLRDVGVSRATASEEAQNWFWR